MNRKIYLAGPEVFHPNAAALGRQKQALCREYGFEGLFPLVVIPFRSLLHMETDADRRTALRASMRTVLEAVTLADVAAGRLPASVRRRLQDPGAWSRR